MYHANSSARRRQPLLSFVVLYYLLWFRIIVASFVVATGAADSAHVSAARNDNDNDGANANANEVPQPECSAASLEDKGHCSESNSNPSGSPPQPFTSFHHLVVLVHGYMGSDREQAYLGEAIMEQSELILNTTTDTTRAARHQFCIKSSQANKGLTTDGIANGGKRLAEEVRQWIREEQASLALLQPVPSSVQTIMTLSLIGNSLGGLYARYAVAELQDLFLGSTASTTSTTNIGPPPSPQVQVLPLVYCSTSSPHLGVTQETYMKLPRWMETTIFARTLERTGADLFRFHNHLKEHSKDDDDDDNEVAEDDVILNMCQSPHFLDGLGQFQKRIAVANAYNTDFLVSVASGAFLDQYSDSRHYTSQHDQAAQMDNEYAILHVTTTAQQRQEPSSHNKYPPPPKTLRSCVEALDNLGWHKIFMDTRDALPRWTQLSLSNLLPPLKSKDPRRAFYTSQELVHQFSRYGTLLPVAHPLNIANTKTELYGKLTQLGRPIMDALAKRLVLDMMDLSEQSSSSSSQ